MSSAERFHEAARRGDTDALKEGTWKDYDRPDEKGMTPAMWAAASGHVEALKILVERGASVNRCDYLGRTALHHAAGNGHVGCVVFLVAFGVNIWSLDSNFNTPLDVAAIHNHMIVVSCLDKAAADQMSSNVRGVKKRRESAIRDAKRRTKCFQKSQQEMEDAGADGMKLSSSRSFPAYPDPGTRPGTSPSCLSLTLSSRLSGRTAMSELRSYPSHFETDSPENPTKASPIPNGSPPNITESVLMSNFASGSPPHVKSASLLSLLTKKLQRKSRQSPGSGSASGNSSLDSMQMGSSTRKPVGTVFGLRFNGEDPIQENDETPDIEQDRSATPFRASSHPELKVRHGIRNFDVGELGVLLPTQISEDHRQISLQDKVPRALEIRTPFKSEAEQKEPLSHDHGQSSRLAVPGINGPGRTDGERIAGNGWANDDGKFEGTKGRNSSANGHYNNRERSGRKSEESNQEIEWFSDAERLGRRNRRTRTENVRSDTQAGSKYGTDWERLRNTRIESRAVDHGGSSLDAFLQAYGLPEYITVLAREKIDMNSLTLVTDRDLKELGIPLGPRRVLLDAVARRRTVLSNPDRMSDSSF